MTEALCFEGGGGDLLSARKVADFVSDGLIFLDQRVPVELNDAVLDALRAYEGDRYRCWGSVAALRGVFSLPWVRGAISSLVGSRPRYDHSFVHVVPAHHPESQNWHADSVIDTRPLAFDLQAFYYPQATTAEMGATLVLPGSHLRRVRNGALGYYRNIVGQRQLVCDAGTVVLMHHGIWHCAQPNRTDTTRYMFKIRMRPGCEQRGLFDTSGFDDPAVTRRIYEGGQPFFGAEASVEHIRRAKLWRYLVGDDSVDVSYEGALRRMGI